MNPYRQVLRDLSSAYPQAEARALARWVFEERFGLSQTDVLLGKDSELSADDRTILQEIASRLLRHEPVQYVLGHVDFCGHRLFVGPGALIPRPETATLVSLICRALPAGFAGGVLDVGTGSACIALSLSLALPAAPVAAWDISPEALAVARRNVALHPAARVALEQADILSPPADERRWALVVSNPPYVLQSEVRDMEPNVLDYEPHAALFVPDDNPLLFYRAVAAYAREHLAPGGWLWFELNPATAQAVADMVGALGYADVRLHSDTFGRTRFLSARLFDEMGTF